MTTTQPAALPDLTAVIAWLENGCDPSEAVKELKHYQSKLRALAALQPKPAAAVSDAEIRSVWLATADQIPHCEHYLHFARAILALRPQAVPMTEPVHRLPMTDEQAKQFLKQSDLLDMFLHIGWYSAPRKGFDEHALSLIRAIEAHHGITAQGAQGGEG